MAVADVSVYNDDWVERAQYNQNAVPKFHPSMLGFSAQRFMSLLQIKSLSSASSCSVNSYMVSLIIDTVPFPIKCLITNFSFSYSSCQHLDSSWQGDDSIFQDNSKNSKNALGRYHKRMTSSLGHFHLVSSTSSFPLEFEANHVFNRLKVLHGDNQLKSEAYYDINLETVEFYDLRISLLRNPVYKFDVVQQSVTLDIFLLKVK